METLPRFYPEAIEHPFENFEIHPVKTRKEGDEIICEVSEPEEATFWSVYVHHKEPEIHGSLACIADVKTELDAEQLLRGLNLCCADKVKQLLQSKKILNGKA